MRWRGGGWSWSSRLMSTAPEVTSALCSASARLDITAPCSTCQRLTLTCRRVTTAHDTPCSPVGPSISVLAAAPNDRDQGPRSNATDIITDLVRPLMNDRASYPPPTGLFTAATAATRDNLTSTPKILACFATEHQLPRINHHVPGWQLQSLPTSDAPNDHLDVAVPRRAPTNRAQRP
jgi:hypothetical protein